MYGEARNEIESLKRSAIQPANNSNPGIRLDNRDLRRRDWSVAVLDTQGPKDDVWPARQKSTNPSFDISDGSPAKQSAAPIDTGNRMPNPYFGAGSGAGAGNPSSPLRNLMLSPIKRPQLSRTRPQFF